MVLIPIAFFSCSDDRAHVKRLCRAIELAGYTEQQACAYMDLRQSQWNDQKSGVGHLSYTRMAKLPSAVWKWYGVLIAEEFGLPREVKAGAVLALGVLGRRRMARMGSVDQKERRSA